MIHALFAQLSLVSISNMEFASSPDEYMPTFYIGQHESDRTRVTPELLRQAQDCNVSCSVPQQPQRPG